MKNKIVNECAIVYAFFAEDCRKLAGALKELGFVAEFYGGISGSMTSKMKERVLTHFREKKIQVICGTEAFGVGVDIPHVRYVIRIGCPPSIQLWVQELGKGGRDGLNAEAVLVYQSILIFKGSRFGPVEKSFEKRLEKKKILRHAGDIYILDFWVSAFAKPLETILMIQLTS